MGIEQPIRQAGGLRRSGVPRRRDELAGKKRRAPTDTPQTFVHLADVLRPSVRYDKGRRFSVPQLLRGDLTVQTESCWPSVESPAILIDQNQACLSYLRLVPGYCI